MAKEAHFLAMGKVLRKWRKKAGYSQMDMADELNIPRSAISKIENDIQKIDIQLFRDWAIVTNNEINAAVVLFGADIFAQAAQLTTLIPAYAVPVSQLFM